MPTPSQQQPQSVPEASGLSVSPTICAYAPPGEYMKDHTLVFHDGWWHLYSISGTAGYCHAYTGNEETVSWSISGNLVDWEFRGHVLHASLRKGDFDQHEVWAPYLLKAKGKFYMYYTGVTHPVRLMSYERKGHDHSFVWDGHKETQGLAVSDDLTSWEKVADRERGLGIPGRDSHVVYDDANGRWLLYSTGSRIGDRSEAYVSVSDDLLNWTHLGVCALFPDQGYAGTTTESLTVMRHPLNGKWILLANQQYALSDDPTDFTQSQVHLYDTTLNGEPADIGYACETIEWQGKWYRSGVHGQLDHWVLGFTEIEWVEDGAFRVVRPSAVALTQMP